MRKLLNTWLLLFLCSYIPLFSQTTTRAVVIGISNYQDEKIPDLKYAHRDVAAFVDFLQSPAGGKVSPENIKTLINEKATVGQIFQVMDWLIEESKEKDQVIIYFSGHGDVETKTIRQRGYLLAHDTPFNNYRSGAIGLDDINDIVATLSELNKSKITLITDACRSGNLAGKAIGGTQVTASALATQFANEIKIMSCQPDEFALESDQWGGGRGLFSFHLIDGLIGLADRNEDYEVNLREIGRYLEDRVSEDAEPESQIPMTVGNKTTRLSLVDDDQLAQLQQRKEKESNVVEGLASKQPRLNFTAGLDSTLAELYADFELAIADKYFLPSDLDENRLPGKSASELYDILSQEASLSSMHNLMKGNFAAALQDVSQQAIIAYLNTDAFELSNRKNHNNTFYSDNSEYLAKAASLLGTSHYLYDKLLAKRYYFKALAYRLKGETQKESALLDTAYQIAQIALQYDDEAAYIYNEMGMIKMKKNILIPSIEFLDSAIIHLDSARIKSPTWAYPVANLATLYTRVRNYQLADSLNKITLELKPDYYQVYNDIARNYKNQNNYPMAKVNYWKVVSIDPLDTIANNNLGAIYMATSQWNPDSAQYYLEQSVVRDSTYFWGNLNLGHLYFDTSDNEKAVFYYKKAIAKRRSEFFPYIYITYSYMILKQYDKAKANLDIANSILPNHFEYHFGMTCWYALQNKIPEALVSFEKALQQGLPYNRITDDSDIDALRDTSKFKELIQEFFPDK